MEMLSERGDGLSAAHALQEEYPHIKAEVFPCKKCGQATCMLIYASYACSAARLEDYARMVYAKVQEINVPTWVVGAEKEVVINGDKVGLSVILKVWPEREKARAVLSSEFNPLLDDLVHNHCNRG